jgi:outer membrane protein OmpA-like peptidoglycan-associated protein
MSASGKSAMIEAPRSKRLAVNLACVALALGLALPVGLGAGLAAEQPSPDQIIKALKPARAMTRGLTTSPADAARRAEESRFVDSLRNRTTRSLTTAEREQVATIAQKRPSIDLEVNFDYNSDKIGPKATPQVTALGQALASTELKGGTFIVAGHTDAKGGGAYNQDLSERRADAVKRFLLEKYGIEASNLVTVGYGKTQLKNPTDPLSGENRRVQVINMSEK